MKIKLFPALMILLVVGFALAMPGAAYAQSQQPPNPPRQPTLAEWLLQKITGIADAIPPLVATATRKGMELVEPVVDAVADFIGGGTGETIKGGYDTLKEAVPAAAAEVAQVVVTDPIVFNAHLPFAIVTSVMNGEAWDSFQGAVEKALNILTLGWYKPSGRPFFGNLGAYNLGYYPGVVIGLALAAFLLIGLFHLFLRGGLMGLIARAFRWLWTVARQFAAAVFSKMEAILMRFYNWLLMLFLSWIHRLGPMMQRILNDIQVSINKIMQAYSLGWEALYAELIVQCVKWWFVILPIFDRLGKRFYKWLRGPYPPLLGAVHSGIPAATVLVVGIPLAMGLLTLGGGRLEAARTAVNSHASPVVQNQRPSSRGEQPTPTPTPFMPLDQEVPVVTLTYRHPVNVSAVLPKDPGYGCFWPGGEVDGVDTNSDGIPDSWYLDMNGDGVHDLVLFDDDGDGYTEAFFLDENFDGKFDCGYVDVDQDRALDLYWRDKNDDGKPQFEEYLELSDIIARASPQESTEDVAGCSSGQIAGGSTLPCDGEGDISQVETGQSSEHSQSADCGTECCAGESLICQGDMPSDWIKLCDGVVRVRSNRTDGNLNEVHVDSNGNGQIDPGELQYRDVSGIQVVPWNDKNPESWVYLDVNNDSYVETRIRVWVEADGVKSFTENLFPSQSATGQAVEMGEPTLRSTEAPTQPSPEGHSDRSEDGLHRQSKQEAGNPTPQPSK